MPPASRTEHVVAAAVGLLLENPFSNDHAGVLEELRAVALSPAHAYVAGAAPALLNVAAVMLLDNNSRAFGLELLGIVSIAWSGHDRLSDIYGDRGAGMLSRPIELLCIVLAVVWPMLQDRPGDETQDLDITSIVVIMARATEYFGRAPVALAVDRELWAKRLEGLLEAVARPEIGAAITTSIGILREGIDITQSAIDRLLERQSEGDQTRLEELTGDYEDCQRRFHEFLGEVRKLIARRKSEQQTQSANDPTAKNPSAPDAQPSDPSL